LRGYRKLQLPRVQTAADGARGRRGGIVSPCVTEIVGHRISVTHLKLLGSRDGSVFRKLERISCSSTAAAQSCNSNFTSSPHQVSALVVRLSRRKDMIGTDAITKQPSVNGSNQSHSCRTTLPNRKIPLLGLELIGILAG
jgi:hypothetical protein